MVVFNYSSRELTTKVVYYGPGLCGKTTNLQFIYDNMPQGVRGKMLSLATKSDRTLFFDFLPIDLGEIQGMKTKVQLYTVPGQVFYNETRRLVLKGADGVVFVADSQENMLEANLDSLKNLEENLAAHGMKLDEMPLVIQYNKRDLPNAMSVERLNETINRFNAPFYEAIATTGVGVQETLRHVTKLVLLSLNEKYGKTRSKKSAATPPAASAPPEPPATPAPAPQPLAEQPPALGLEPEAPAAPAVQEPLAPAAEAPVLDPEPAAVPLADEPAAVHVAPAETPAEAQVAAQAAAPAVAVHEPPPAAERADVLAIPDAFGGQGGSFEEDEDVLGVAPVVAAPAPEPAPPEAAAAAAGPGATIKLDREQVSELIGTGYPAASESPAAPAAEPAEPVAAAAASLEEVSARDPLFGEPGVEPTRLVPGVAQEILVPVEIETAQGVRRFRLTLRLEVES